MVVKSKNILNSLGQEIESFPSTFYLFFTTIQAGVSTLASFILVRGVKRKAAPGQTRSGRRFQTGLPCAGPFTNRPNKNFRLSVLSYGRFESGCRFGPTVVKHYLIPVGAMLNGVSPDQYNHNHTKVMPVG